MSLQLLPMVLASKSHETIAVFDLGGGTFDILILEIDNGNFHVQIHQWRHLSWW